MAILLFEISDKVIPVGVLYAVFFSIGLIGFLVGYFKWWASLFWLIGPTLVLTLVIGGIQYAEYQDLGDQMNRELGTAYLVHNMAAPPVGVVFNIGGIMFWYFRTHRRSI